MPGKKELCLMKDQEKFVFRYEPGNEEEVLDAFVNMANNRASSFDWFDAAVLSFQLTKHLVDEADKLLCSSTEPPGPEALENQTPWSPL